MKNLFLQKYRGNLINCLTTSVLCLFRIEQDKLMSKTAQVQTRWKNNFFWRKSWHCIIHYEFSRAINKENQNFYIQGLTHSAVKRSHGDNVRNLIQKIENHPQRRTLQSDLQQHRQFNHSEKNHETWLKQLETVKYEWFDVEPKAKSKVCLSHCDVNIVYCTCGHFLRDGTKENKAHLNFTLDPFSIQNYCIKKRATARTPLREEKKNHDCFITNIRDERFRKSMPKEHCATCVASGIKRISFFS